MENTNQLHKEHLISVYGNHRIYPKSSKSILTKTKLTKKLTQSQAANLFAEAEKGNFQGSAKLIIEFTTEKEGNKLARALARLPDNPAFKLDVTFKKINKNENKN